MPKELHEISHFNVGTITTPSETDVPENAATYSKNIDPIAKDGVLKPIPDNSQLYTGGIYSPTYTKGANLNHDDIEIKAIDGFGPESESWVIVIETEGPTDFFKWSSDGGDSYTIDVGCSTNYLTLGDRVKVKWDSTTGHVVGDKWEFDLESQATDVDADKITIIENDGVYDAIYFDNSDKKIKSINDLYGTPTLVDLSTGAESVTGIPVFEKNNKEVHIGMGNGVDDKALWAGIINHQQFGTYQSSDGEVDGTFTPIVADANLSHPNAFPDMFKTIFDGSYYYGIERNGKYVYIFEYNAGGITYKYRSKQVFESTRALAYTTDSEGNTELWVYDYKDNGAAADQQFLYKIDGVKGASLITCEITSGTFNTNADSMLSMIIHGGKIIFLSGETATMVKLYFVEIPTAHNNTLGVSSCYIRNNFDDTHSSHSSSTVFTKTNSTTVGCHVDYYVPEHGLFKIPDSNWVGVFATVYLNGENYDTESLTGITHRTPDDGENTFHNNIRNVCFMINMSAVTLNGQQDIDDSNGAVKCLVYESDVKYDDPANKMYAMSNEFLNDYVWYTYDCVENDVTTCRVGFFPSPANNATSLHKIDDVDIIECDDELDLMGAYPSAKSFKDGEQEEAYLSQGKENELGRIAEISCVDAFSNPTWSDIEAVSSQDLRLVLGGGSGSGSLISDNWYFYRASYIYDGYQESPMGDEFRRQCTSSSLSITAELYNLNSFNKRISHIAIYRAESPDPAEGSDAPESPTGFYRHVINLELDSRFGLTLGDTTNPDWGDKREFTFIDKGRQTASYEAKTGISEVINHTTMGYGLSAQLNNQLFVAHPYNLLFDKISNYIFKSRPYSFDQFNIIADYLKLPTKPTAIVSFMGRIYAFDENNTYRIEPNNLYIEDTFEGAGCMGPDSFVVTEHGMCYADKNNIYFHDGRRPVRIADAILTGDTYSWQNRDTSWNSKIMFDSTRNSFIVLFKYSSNYYAWAYNIVRKRWDLWDFGSNEPKGVTSGKNGEMFINADSKLRHYLGGTGSQAYDWTSKKLTMGTNTQEKRFKKLKIEGSPSGSLGTNINIKLDGSAVTETGTLNEFTLSDKKGKHIQWVLSSQEDEIDALGTIYRRRPVK